MAQKINKGLQRLFLIGVALILFHHISFNQEVETSQKATRLFEENEKAFLAGDYDQAVEGYLKASKLFYSTGDTLMYLRSKGRYAKSVYFTSKIPQAVQLAISINKELENSTVPKNEIYIRLLMDIGIIFVSSQQELLLGEVVLSKAAKLLEETSYGNNIDRIENYVNLAGIQYYLRKLLSAERNYVKASQIASKDTITIKSHLPNIILGLSIIQSDAGKFKKALEGYEFLLEHSENSQNMGRKAWILSSMALVHNGQGFYNKAIAYYREAIRIYESLGMHESQSIIQPGFKIGELLIKLNRPREAITELYQNYLIEKKLLGPNHPNHIYTYSSLSRAYASLNSDSSTYFLRKERELILMHYGDSTELYSTLHEKLADISFERKNFSDALRNYQIAYTKRLSLLGEKHPSTVKLAYRLGTTEWKLEYFEKALEYLDIVASNSEIDITSNKISLRYSNPEVYIDAIGIKASILLKQSQNKSNPEIMEAASREFERYDSLINAFRKEVGHHQDKSILWENYRKTMDSMMPYLIWKYDQSESKEDFYRILLALDKFKYISLNEKLTAKQRTSFVNDTIKEKINILLKETAQLKSNLISEKTSSESSQAIKSRLFQINKELEVLQPHTISETFDEKKILESLNAIKSKSDVVSYYMTEDNIYILFMTHKGDFLKKVSIDEGFKESLAALNAALSSPSTHVEHFKILSKKIYDYLVLPIRKEISKEHIIILPDQLLHLVPFEALVTKQSVHNQFKELPYLIRELEVSYAPSLSSLQLLNKKANITFGQPLAVAPSFGASDITSSNLSFQSSERAGYGELFWTKKEADLIEKFYGGQVLSKDMASKPSLLSKISNPLILHFATHSVMDDQSAEFSHIILSSSDSIDMEKNKLYAFEVYNSNIRTEMAVLSACNTGNGILNKGEGIINLANSFFQAGANSVVFSLWLANDQSTYNVISSFYEHLALSETKSGALRKAKTKYLEETNEITAHPYYWAHLVVSGKNTSIQSGTDSKTIVMLLGMALILLMLWLAYRWQFKRHSPNFDS